MLPVSEWAQAVNDNVPPEFQDMVREHLQSFFLFAKAHSKCDVLCRFCFPKSKNDDLLKQRVAFRHMLLTRALLNEPRWSGHIRDARINR